MYKTISGPLVSGCRVMDALIQRYGLAQVQQIERLRPRLFRVRLTGGNVASCEIQEDGSLEFQEPECVC